MAVSGACRRQWAAGNLHQPVAAGNAVVPGKAATSYTVPASHDSLIKGTDPRAPRVRLCHEYSC